MLRIGSHHPMPDYRLQKLVLVNRIIWSSLPTVVALGVYSLVTNAMTPYGVFSGVLGLILALVFNHLGLFEISRFLVVGFPAILVTVVAGMLNPADNPIPPGRLFQLSLLAFPVAIYDVREWKPMALSILFALLLYLGFEPLNEWLREGEGSPIVFQTVFRYVFIVFSAAMLLIAVGLLVRANFFSLQKITALVGNLQEANEELKASIDTIERQNEDIRESIVYARRIQESLLPDLRMLETLPLKMSLFYAPRDIVSGDFYWFARLPDAFVLAGVDCTGHGVPGAFMSVLGRSLLQQAVEVEGIRDPAVILERLDIGVRDSLGQDRQDAEALDGMELSLLVLDPTARKVRYGGANRPLWVWHNGELEEIDGVKRPVGGKAYRDRPFATVELNLNVGDRLYIFSDGVTDQNGGPKNRKFGKQSLREQLLKNADLPLNLQVRRAEEALKAWQGREHQRDDILLIGVEAVNV